MGRPPCCDKANVKRGPWTPEEDAKILAYVASHGIGNWTLVPQKAGLNRCGKSCRLRWTNYLRPDLKHDNFTPEEEECILELHKTIGSRWSLIAKRLPGRTDNDVKNYWNTKLKKKLTKMGIDPVTHKPFSQLFSEYGKISGVNPAGSRTRNPFLQNSTGNDGSFLWKPENTRQKIMDIKPRYDLLNDNDNNNVAPPVGIMPQFQVHKHEIVQLHFFSEISPRDAFSSSNVVTHFGCGPPQSCEASSQAQTVPPSPFLCSSSNGVTHFGCGQPQSFEASRVQTVPPSSPILCNEYILGDPDQMTECKYTVMMPSDSDAILPVMQSLEQGESSKMSCLGAVDKCSTGAPSSTAADSFVEAILAHDNEMRLQFPTILDECYDDC